MEQKIWLNGEFIPESKLGLKEMRRAFQYGDGLFESMLFENGAIRFFDFHLERLKNGMRTFKIEIPDYLNIENIQNQALKLVELNGFSEKARFRLFAWRAGEAMYMPSGEAAHLMLECAEFIPIPQDFDFKLGVFEDVKKPLSRFSEFKNMNASLYVQAGIFCRENNFHEALIFNQLDNICESLYSNVFIIKNEKISTSGTDEACIAGVMRRVVFEHCIRNNYSIEYSGFDLKELILADEIFLTNSVKGIQSIKKFHGKEFQTKITEKIRREIFQT